MGNDNNQNGMNGTITYRCEVCKKTYPSELYICPNCNTPNSIRYVSGDKIDIMSQHTEASVLAEGNIGHKTATLGFKTGISEIDKVFGDALQPGATIFLGGRKGLGKSTLSLQIAFQLSKLPEIKRIWYFSTEEERGQIENRAHRLKCFSDKIEILCPTFSLDIILNKLSQEGPPDFLIVDSITNLVDTHEKSAAGSVKQIACCGQRLISITKSIKKFPLLLISGVSKAGTIAGPERIGHLVDVVFYIEGIGKTDQRCLVSNKNRYSPTTDIGLFEMGENGLEPSQLRMKMMGDADGCEKTGLAFAIMFVKRIPVGIEVQAIMLDREETITSTKHKRKKEKTPKSVKIQVIENYSASRKKIILSALEFSNCRINKNFFCKLPVKIEDEPIELAIAVSIFSALRNISIPRHVVFLGEISPNGEIKEIGGINDRLEYAAKEGFKTVISGTHISPEMSHGLECVEFNTLAELFKAIEETDSANKKPDRKKSAKMSDKRKVHLKKKRKQKPKKKKSRKCLRTPVNKKIKKGRK